MAPGTRANPEKNDEIVNFLKSEEFSDIVSALVSNQNGELLTELRELREEVRILKESNIQLIHLLVNQNPQVKYLQSKSTDTSSVANTTKAVSFVNNATKTSKAEKQKSKDLTISVKNKDDKHKKLSQPMNSQNTSANRINEADGDTKDKDGPWEFPKRKRRNTIIYGNLKDNSIFKGVTKYVDFHVYNCDLELKADDLKKYLTNDVKISNVQCEAMKSKYPERYSSFKISIPVNHIETFKDPNIWPEYVCINRYKNFFLRRNTPSQEGQP